MLALARTEARSHIPAEPRKAEDALAECLKELLREVVAEEIRRALADHNGGPRPLLLDTNQTAKLLQVPPSWVASAARRGDIPSVKLGHHVRFRVADIEDFIEQKNRETDNEHSLSNSVLRQ